MTAPQSTAASPLLISDEQVRAARILLNWSQYTLAKAADLDDARLIVDFERGLLQLSNEQVEKVKQALEQAGIIFEEAGVRLFKAGESSATAWEKDNNEHVDRSAEGNN